MKKNIAVSVSSFLLAIFLSACKEDYHDVSYYDNHKEERREKVMWCMNNVGVRSDNCLNALHSENKSSLSSSNMPSI